MKNQLKTFFSKPIVLLALAAMLLVSGIGSTQAAITAYSENYVADVDVPNVGVDILEGGQTVTEILGAIDEEIILGKTYEEVLTAKNTGKADSYLRVIIKKHWEDAEGEKDRTLSPEYIELTLANLGTDWILDQEASTAERTVLYYKHPTASGEETTNFTSSLRIDNAFETTVSVDKKVEQKDGGTFTTLTYTHPFKDYTFHVEVEADAVQLFEAVKAIKSEWGIDVAIDANGDLSLGAVQPQAQATN